MRLPRRRQVVLAGHGPKLPYEVIENASAVRTRFEL